jgi:hypothetical protein
LNRNDQDALIKIIRLIANLLTVEEIGYDLFKNKKLIYRDLVKKVRNLIHEKSID